jgi:hypothetical protein
MTPKTYTIHRAIGRPIRFKGLAAQYIVMTAAALLADLFLFALLYCCGISPWLCTLLVFGFAAGTVSAGWLLSKRFGEHGLMKHFAAKNLPRHIRCGSRSVFLHLKKQSYVDSIRKDLPPARN